MDESAAPAAAPAAGDDASVSTDDTSPQAFTEEVTHVQYDKSGMYRYQFVITGQSTYIPGYMLKGRPLQKGSMVRGMKQAAPNQKLAFRATEVADDHAKEANEPQDDEDNIRPGLRKCASDDEEGDGSSNGESIQYEEDGWDEGGAEAEEMTPEDAAESLRAYIVEQGGEIRIVAPPLKQGSLAHFYRCNPAAAEVRHGPVVCAAAPSTPCHPVRVALR